MTALVFRFNYNEKILRIAMLHIPYGIC